MTGILRPCVAKVLRTIVLTCLGCFLPTASVGQTIIWTANAGRIQRKDVNGGEVQTIIQFPAGQGASWIHYDPVDAKLYYLHGGTPTSFQRANLDGSDPENIPTPSVGNFTLNVELRKLYWMDAQVTDHFYRSELDGSAVESHSYPSCCLFTLLALGEDLFFSAGLTLDKGIWRADADGSNEQFLPGSPGPGEMAYDPVENKLYIAPAAHSGIYRMNPDGTDVELVLDLLVDVVVVDARGRKVYWADRDARVIQRCNMDGSNLEDFVTASDVGDPNFTPGALTIVYSSTPVPDPNGAKGRVLSFFVPPPSASGPVAQTAIRLSMITLQHPDPPNAPCCPPPDFSAYESSICTAPGESNGCARWVGKPGTFYESQGPPVSGPYTAARLQCTPFYFDWVTQTAGSPINVVSAEIVPSSTYTIQAYGESCNGSEAGCTDVSPALTMFTRRSGDVELPFNPPSTTTQPDVTDVAQLVNKFKNVSGAPVKAVAQLQPNLPELNADLNALDIVAVVDAVKLRAYAFSGPCGCPSPAICGALACTSDPGCRASGLPGLGTGTVCVKTCSGPGPLTGDSCVNNTHCVGSGTCGAGFCRDRCGRCTP